MLRSWSPDCSCGGPSDASSVRRRLSDVRVGPGTRRDGAARRRESLDRAEPRSSCSRTSSRRRSGAPARLVVTSVLGRRAQRVSATRSCPQARGRYRLGPLRIDVTDAVRPPPEPLARRRAATSCSSPRRSRTSSHAAGRRERGRRRSGSRAPTAPHRRGLLHDARLPGGRRSPTDPLAVGRPDRRADDPAERGHAARERARVPGQPRSGASGGRTTAAFERAVSCAASVGVLLARNGFVLRLGTADTPASTLSEDRFLDALAGVAHGTRPIALQRAHPPSERRLARRLARVRGGAAAPAGTAPAPARAGSRVRPEARDLDPPGRSGHRSRPAAGRSSRARATQATLALTRAGWDCFVLYPVDEVERTMARTAGTTARVQRLTSLVADRARRRRGWLRVRTRVHGHGAHVPHARRWRRLRRGRVGLRAAEPPARDRRERWPCSSWRSGSSCSRRRTWYGAPTLDTLAADGTRRPAASARRRASQVSPAAPVAPLCFAAITAVWAAVFSCSRAGVPRRQPAPGARSRRSRSSRSPTACSTSSSSPIYGVLFLIAALASCSPTRSAGSRGGARSGAARVPGSLLPSAATAERAPDRRRHRRARRAGRPFLVPGFGSKAVIDLSSINADDRVTSARSWRLASIAHERRPASTSSRSSPTSPTYWRMSALRRLRRQWPVGSPASDKERRSKRDSRSGRRPARGRRPRSGSRSSTTSGTRLAAGGVRSEHAGVRRTTAVTWSRGFADHDRRRAAGPRGDLHDPVRVPDTHRASTRHDQRGLSVAVPRRNEAPRRHPSRDTASRRAVDPQTIRRRSTR